MPGTKIIGTKDYSFSRKIRTRAFSNTCPVTQISSTLIGSWARDHVITNTLPRVMSSKKVLFKIILSWHRDGSLFSTFGYLLFYFCQHNEVKLFYRRGRNGTFVQLCICVMVRNKGERSGAFYSLGVWLASVTDVALFGSSCADDFKH